MVSLDTTLVVGSGDETDLIASKARMAYAEITTLSDGEQSGMKSHMTNKPMHLTAMFHVLEMREQKGFYPRSKVFLLQTIISMNR
jgi:hypothetical protein